MAEALPVSAEFTVLPALYDISSVETVAPQLKVVDGNQENHPRLIGDFVERRPNENVGILNEVFSRMGEIDRAEVERKTKKLEDNVLMYRELVMQGSEISQRITERYAAADKKWADKKNKELSMEDRARERLATSNGINLFSDFDGTISKDPNSYLLTNIPGSAIAEPMLDELGRDKFSFVHTNVWARFLQIPETHGVYFQGGQAVTIREGVNELFGDLKEKGAKITVLSANFEPFVQGGLSQIPNAENINFIAVSENSILATDKGTVLTDFSQRNEKLATIFVGDGSSDIAAMEASDVVAAYFALEGSSFAKALEERGLTHFTYRDFNDIRLKLQELTAPPVEQN